MTKITMALLLCVNDSRNAIQLCKLNARNELTGIGKGFENFKINNRHAYRKKQHGPQS